MQNRSSLRQRWHESSSKEKRALISITKEKSNNKSKESGSKLVSQNVWILLFIYYFIILALVQYSFNALPSPKSKFQAKSNEFIEEYAREHLNNLVKLGHRPAGGIANDVNAVNYILKAVDHIQSIAHPSVKFEVDIQRPSGSFTMDFLGGFGSCYSNVTNTVVQLSPANKVSEHALLLNCHTDSVNGAPGASDDAIACAVMLEIMRAIAEDTTKPLLHTIIFLFNGAEENILQASHGFITQHQWAKKVKAFINLEAAGAGGKEVVFQTGPHHPWLAQTWANLAPHPFGSILGQEVFQSGIIPSDTDFRIFRDYGKIPGIDLAYMKNGFVYHTRYDDVAMILPGCIQRAGDNILAVVDHLVKSTLSLLPNPGAYQHGSLAFVDIMGMYMITIPFRLLFVLNLMFSVGPVIFIAKRVIFCSDNKLKFGKLIVKAATTIVFSWVACVFVVILVAGFVTRYGNAMSFYSKPYLVVFLYALPGLGAMLLVHCVSALTTFKKEDPVELETVFFDTYLFIWSLFLFQLNNLQLQSSLIPLLCVMPIVLIRIILLRDFFNPENNVHCLKRASLYLISLIPHSILIFSHSWLVMEFFVPLCGRLGSEIPPDLVIGILTALLLIFGFHFVLSLVHVIKSTRWVLAIIFVLNMFAMCITISSFGFPYDVSSETPSPKRLFVQHISRSFYGYNKMIKSSDSGLWINAMDYSGLNIDIGSDALHKTSTLQCKGLFCHFPFLVPVDKLIKNSKYLSVPKPSSPLLKKNFFSVNLTKHEITKISENSTSRVYKKYLEFAVTGPSHMSVQIAPLLSKGCFSALTRWCINGDITVAQTYPTAGNSYLFLENQQYEYKDWYFLYYGSGLSRGLWQPWFEFTITQDKTLLPFADNSLITVEMAFSAQYYSDDKQIPLPAPTSEVETFLSDVHDWVAPISWISLYENYLF